MPKLLPGSAAPDLMLRSVTGEPVQLSQHWENTPALITFYRGDSCPVCNRYLHALQERQSEFENAGVRVVAISADEPELGQQTIKRHDLPFTVLADPDRQAIEAYDVIFNEAEKHAEPAVFIVAPGGSLAYESIVSGPPGRPSPDDVLAILQRMTARSSTASR